jgi:hypothetical protein
MFMPAPVRGIAGIAFPWRVTVHQNVSALRWCLHAAFWLSVVAALWWLNRWSGVEGSLRSPAPMLHRTWLPLVGVLVYTLVWLSQGLWLAMQRDPPPSGLPDLDAAWDQAWAGLERSQIDLSTTPIYLVLGSLTDEMRALLAALGAAPMAQRPNAPVHVWAQREAVFVVFAGHADGSADRLQALCERLRGIRGASPALQGVVLSVPFAALQSVAGAQAVSTAVRDELEIVRLATGLEAPLYVMIGAANLPTTERAWLQRFPPVPDLDPAEVPAMYRAGLDDLCVRQIGREILARFRLDGDNESLFAQLRAFHASRARLVRLLVEGTGNDATEPGMVAGCYFLPAAGAGAAWTALGQALLADLRTNQDCPAWTAETVQARARQRRQAWIGYAFGLASLCLGLAGVAGYLYART